eukprot:1156130-Pelagomonas_calceolata.AAC.1
MPQSRRLTASLFINAHEIMKEERKFVVILNVKPLNVKQRHVHLIEIKYCEDTRPGQHLEAAQWQHAGLCKLVDAKLGLDHQRANKLACKLHAHSVMYANNRVTTRRAIENNNTCHSQVTEPGASSNPPDPLQPSRGNPMASWRQVSYSLQQSCHVGRYSYVTLDFPSFHSHICNPSQVWSGQLIQLSCPYRQAQQKKERRVYARHRPLALRKGPLTSKLARAKGPSKLH